MTSDRVYVLLFGMLLQSAVDWVAYDIRRLTIPLWSGVWKPQARCWQNRLPLRLSRTLPSEGPVHPWACSGLCCHMVIKYQGIVTS